MKTGLLAGLFSVLFSATVFAAPVLKINSSGRDVMLLQQKLQNVGCTIKDIDGIFGEETKRVVTQFQGQQPARDRRRQQRDLARPQRYKVHPPRLNQG